MLISGNSFVYSTDILQMHSNIYWHLPISLVEVLHSFFSTNNKFWLKYKNARNSNVKVY